MKRYGDNSFARKLVQSAAVPGEGSRSPQKRDSLPPQQPQSLSHPSQPSTQLSSNITQSPVNTRGHENNSAAQQFLKWINKLDERVRSLENRIPSEDVGILEREANTCKAELQHLYNYAATQEVKLEECYNQLISIRDRLQSIDRKLQEKKEKIEKGSRHVWIKVVNIVLRAISIVADILGLAPLGGLFRTIQNALPSGGTKQLPSGGNHKFFK